MTNLRARLAEVLARLDAMPLLLAKDAAALLRQQADALARALEDAERYAWLRDRTFVDWKVTADKPYDGGCYQYIGATLDAAIDAAMDEHNRRRRCGRE